MTAVAIFEAPEGQHIRVVTIDGDPWFAAVDVCRILGLTNPTMALRALEDDEKGLSQIETLGGPQQMAIVSESGLYALIVRSDKPAAKPFRRWVTADVLPTIRRTGSYSSAPALPQNYAAALRELAASVEEREALAGQVAVLEPRAAFADQILDASGDYSVADAAKILSRDPAIKLGRDRLFTLLAEWRWIYRAGDHRWRVYQTAIEAGRLSELASSHYHPRTGELVIDPPQVRVTVKGLGVLHKRLDGSAALAISDELVAA